MAEKKVVDYGIVAYILGIVSIVLSIFSPIPALILAIVGFVHSRKAENNIARNLNIAAMIISVIGIAVGGYMVFKYSQQLLAQQMAGA